MSITLPSITQPAAGRRSGWLVRICFGWARGIRRHLVRRDAMKNLAELSDRELADIGLRRCQIEEAVRGILADPDRTRF
jgi:uncharacterized protein YjiS (DUF1127 family)